MSLRASSIDSISVGDKSIRDADTIKHILSITDGYTIAYDGTSISHANPAFHADLHANAHEHAHYDANGKRIDVPRS